MGVFHRVSIRKYQPKAVEPDKIEKILRAAMQAPSACNQQPWEFYVVTDKDKILELSQVHTYSGCAAGAPVCFVPCYRKDVIVPPYAQIDMSACVENLLLEADDQGLGAVWMGIAPDRARMDRLSALLDIPDTLEPFALIPCGYPAEDRPQEDRFDESRVHYI